jgi:hypothetical protein
MGDIVDSDKGLSYRPASLCSQAGLYDNSMPESTLSPQSGTMNLATGVVSCRKVLNINQIVILQFCLFSEVDEKDKHVITEYIIHLQAKYHRRLHTLFWAEMYCIT